MRSFSSAETTTSPRRSKPPNFKPLRTTSDSWLSFIFLERFQSGPDTIENPRKIGNLAKDFLQLLMLIQKMLPASMTNEFEAAGTAKFDLGLEYPPQQTIFGGDTN
ncbi:hypothetical protein AVEN_98000-1 [Araneus ventricosus]|uniref:Uncharacterized protein n=1 Tax=Araneus ventricosus TaxID=182803 RepID=A0A4Y2RTK2_ARAVE|nr:hypothetical protein AVEN_207435-1 [Araneus ventricosus]GBN75794.1 hypothetical protein AVEN_220685-1 [Araneus ventricosus]GBN79195.1 hypothetical protein AVEN_85747-1 [Araneus ventricosus]GBN79202.1 hypothetical protein AVEN_98000-1 [Araneus ventricosus]